jgi:hypothetical protein
MVSVKKPNWFNLKKYDQSRKFSKADWFEQFVPRFFLYHVDDELLKDYSLLIFSAIKKEIYPDNSGMVLAHLQTFRTPNLHAISKDDDLFQTNVWSTTLQEVLQLASTNSKSIINKSELVKPIDTSVIKGDVLGRRHLTIDLNATNEEIHADFKKWLNTAKSQYDENEKRHIINENHEVMWSQHRILAYLDLLIWCRFKGYEIKNHGDVTYTQLVQWVFDDRHPNGVTPEKIRTTKRYVSELMTFNFINRLFKYAYGESQHDSLMAIMKRFMRINGINPADIL